MACSYPLGFTFNNWPPYLKSTRFTFVKPPTTLFYHKTSSKWITSGRGEHPGPCSTAQLEGADCTGSRYGRGGVDLIYVEPPTSLWLCTPHDFCTTRQGIGSLGRHSSLIFSFRSIGNPRSRTCNSYRMRRRRNSGLALHRQVRYQFASNDSSPTRTRNRHFIIFYYWM